MRSMKAFTLDEWLRGCAGGEARFHSGGSNQTIILVLRADLGSSQAMLLKSTKVETRAGLFPRPAWLFSRARVYFGRFAIFCYSTKAQACAGHAFSTRHHLERNDRS
jgi:hypothetical protein